MTPLTPSHCDCTDLDGFMLNTERLMASELVALSTHEEIGAAIFLWCRAWKQIPAASLPDDDKINAAFAKLTLKRFVSLKKKIMRGFVKCDDGRLYHKHLAAEALVAYEKKTAFKMRRKRDAERLKTWRETHVKHVSNDDNERFVREGQGQGQGHLSKKEPFGAQSASLAVQEPLALNLVAAPLPEAELYRRGKEILGKQAGGLVTQLLKSRGGNIALARSIIEVASTKGDPKQYLGGVLKGRDKTEEADSFERKRERGEAW